MAEEHFEENLQSPDAGRLLGQLIHQLINSRDFTSVSRVATLTQTDRSSLYQFFDGKRLPTLRFLRELVHLLRLTSAESDELFELYHICRDGSWENARNREVLSFFDCIRKARTPVKTYDMVLGDGTDLCGPIESWSSLLETLRWLLQNEVQTQEQPSLCLVLSTPELLQDAFLPECIRRCQFPAGRMLEVSQVLEIDRSQPLTGMNVAEFLAPIKHAVNLYCDDRLLYQPAIAYTDTFAYTLPNVLYPNYLIFTEHILLITSDGKSGVCLHSRETADAYRAVYHSIHLHTQCTELRASGTIEALDQFIDYSIDLQSSFEHFGICHDLVLYPQYTEALIEKYIREEIPGREQIIPRIIAYYDQWLCNKQLLHCYLLFTPEGLLRFAREGVAVDLPSYLVKPIEPADRLRLLPDTEDQRRYTYAIVNTEKLALPDFFSVCISNKSLLFTDERFEKKFDTLMLRDLRIVQLFNDTFHSLLTSEYVYSADEQKAIWQKARGIIEAQLPKEG